MSRYTPPDRNLQLNLFEPDCAGCDHDLDIEVDAFDCDVEGRAEIATSKILDIVLAPHWQNRRGLGAQIEPLVLSELCQLIEEIRARCAISAPGR